MRVRLFRRKKPRAKIQVSNDKYILINEKDIHVFGYTPFETFKKLAFWRKVYFKKANPKNND